MDVPGTAAPRTYPDLAAALVATIPPDARVIAPPPPGAPGR
jgi:hypothetical protein